MTLAPIRLVALAFALSAPATTCAVAADLDAATARSHVTNHSAAAAPPSTDADNAAHAGWTQTLPDNCVVFGAASAGPNASTDRCGAPEGGE